MRILLVDGGAARYFLARSLVARGDRVTIVHPDAATCEDLARRLGAVVVHGDGSDPRILREAGAAGADVVLALTDRDHDNLVTAQLASLLYEVPRTLALANDPDNRNVFEQLGITAFSTVEVISHLIEQRVSLASITNLLSLGEGRVNVTEVVLPADSPATGHTLSELPLPEGALVAVVIRGSEPIVPRGATRLEARDRVLLVTLPENHGPVLKVFTGEA